MTDDTGMDYTEIASRPIDDVKTAVEEHDLDLEQLLDAEKDGKNRVTLIRWLEERIEGAVPEEVDVMEAGNTARYVSMEMLPVQERTVTLFGGLVLGIVLVTALVMAGVFGPGTDTTPEATLQEDVAAYLEANQDALLGQAPSSDTSLTVTDITAVEGTGLYEVTVTLEATIQNQTLSQDSSAYVTANGQYLLFGTLFDMSRPIADQTATQ